MFQRNTLIGIALASALVFSGLNAAYADNHQKKTPAEKSANLQKELNLTDDQTKKVEAIIKTQHEKADKIRAEAKALREETHKKLSEVLTPEQMKKYDEKREKRMKNSKDDNDKKDNNDKKNKDNKY